MGGVGRAAARVAVALGFLTAALMAPPLDAHGPAATDKTGPRPDLSALFGGPFALIDHDGKPRTERDFPGKFLLISFGYTHCPDICPLDLSAMAAALDRLQQTAELIQPLFITIDPARDKPGVLKAFVGNFDPRLIGLTGSEAQIAAVAKAYRVHRRKVVVPDASPGDYLASHSSLTYLMAPDGAFLTMFPHGTQARFMADAIRQHMKRAGRN